MSSFDIYVFRGVGRRWGGFRSPSDERRLREAGRPAGRCPLLRVFSHGATPQHTPWCCRAPVCPQPLWPSAQGRVSCGSRRHTGPRSQGPASGGAGHLSLFKELPVWTGTQSRGLYKPPGTSPAWSRGCCGHHRWGSHPGPRDHGRTTGTGRAQTVSRPRLTGCGSSSPGEAAPLR